MSVSEEIADVIAAKEEEVSTGDRTEVVMDLSMKKKRVRDDDSDEQREVKGDAVKVEMIQSAFEVKISELIINADKKNTEVHEGGDATIERKVPTTQRPKRAKKRKQSPEKIIQGCKVSDYVTEPALQRDLATTTEEIVIETTDADNASLIITKASNGGDIVHVDTELEVETSKPIAVLAEEDQEEGDSLPFKVPTVTVATTEISKPTGDAAELPLAQLQSSLFSTTILGSNSKPMRPFKLYTQNRDLLAGIGLNQTNMNTLAAALSGRPLVSSTIVGSTASLPITAFAPLNVKNPLIPTTIPTGVPETTISQVGSTAGSNGKLLSAATSVITSTTTSSAMRLMTLATAADKILKGKKEEQDVDDDASEKDTNVPLIIASSDGSTPAVGHVNEDGTIELTLDATSPERLALIQQQIAMTPETDLDEPKSKKSKKRQQLPESLKTPNYWERRRKNNEAAKRSRDARRAKEDQIAIRAAILEHENTRLKIELKALKEETAKLRAEIYERKKSDPK